MNSIRTLVLLCCCPAFSGCAYTALAGNVLGGKQRTFSGDDQIRLARPASDPVSLVVNAGKSTGFSSITIQDAKGVRSEGSLWSGSGNPAASLAAANYAVGGSGQPLAVVTFGRGGGVNSAVVDDAIGKNSSANIIVSINPDRQSLKVDYIVTGNFGAGSEKAGKKLFEEFKRKVLEESAH